MEINVYQQVLLKGKPNTLEKAYREFESNVIPHKGDLYADSAFKDPYEYEVVEVTIDYQNNVCSVCIEPIEIESTDPNTVTEHIKMMMKHGWKCFVL